MGRGFKSHSDELSMATFQNLLMGIPYGSIPSATMGTHVRDST